MFLLVSVAQKCLSLLIKFPIYVSINRQHRLNCTVCKIMFNSIVIYSSNPYKSVDPAPPSLVQDTKMLKNTLLDESSPLFERYRYSNSVMYKLI